MSGSKPFTSLGRQLHNVKQIMREDWTFKHWIFTGIAALFLCSAGWLFFDQWVAGLILMIFAPFYPVWKNESWKEQKRFLLAVDFKQALEVVSSYLRAGRSVESAFRESMKDLSFLFPDPQSPIMTELKRINRQVDTGEPIEKAIYAFAVRSRQEDILNFAEVFVISKRSGGNLAEVLRRTVQMIGEKLEIQQDISVIVAQKKFESRLLMGAPFCFLLLLKISSPDYMNPLYAGKGILIMLVSLILLIVAMLLSHKITDIKI
ncbi:type II secretion system F family protein [Marinicrinis sediminis]|uniref:Type II secretion system F family protein n=1 Tax=Marinicrinis sediminis TaxID=1652465 RepID=A0ABW5REN1_9BACL